MSLMIFGNILIEFCAKVQNTGWNFAFVNLSKKKLIVYLPSLKSSCRNERNTR